jgi:hypothetical protein
MMRLWNVVCNSTWTGLVVSGVVPRDLCRAAFCAAQRMLFQTQYWSQPSSVQTQHRLKRTSSWTLEQQHRATCPQCTGGWYAARGGRAFGSGRAKPAKSQVECQFSLSGLSVRVTLDSCHESGSESCLQCIRLCLAPAQSLGLA